MSVSDLPPTPATHFKLHFYAAVLHAMRQVSQLMGSYGEAVEQFPFFEMYRGEIERVGGHEALDGWSDQVRDWEAAVDGHLPIRALCAVAPLTDDHLQLLLATGLCEEDPHFGLLFEQFQGIPGLHRPTLATLNAWFASGAYRLAADLEQLGIIRIINPEAPRAEWIPQPEAGTWSLLRGDQPPDLRTAEHLVPLDKLILPDLLRDSTRRLIQLLGSGAARGVIVRGPQHNGRRTLVGSIARGLGRGLLQRPPETWPRSGPYATAAGCLPLLVVDPAPGERVEVPRLFGYSGPVAVVLGRYGAVFGAGVDGCVQLELEMPDRAQRRLHWTAALGPDARAPLDALSDACRLSGGSIRHVAGVARAQAALHGRASVHLEDVREAARTLDHEALEVLATRVSAPADWGLLVLPGEILEEIRRLEDRCRARETLAEQVGPALRGQLSTGVRALFSGPSGTGKTLAARVLAASLGKDLYRVDLSTVVNKYIGETEKNLHRLFERAEELDVVLLLDEGDALLTQRTAVQTSNDRYANLETNYLLQRLESFQGVLLITSNASQRIDSAFQRRMDVIVEFRLPNASERWAIWQMHLPVAHAVDPAFLEEVSGRCTLNGGQIRNAAIFATLLASQSGSGVVDTTRLETAIRREYGKAGAACPLRTVGRNGVLA